jgi:hypothetical protein
VNRSIDNDNDTAGKHVNNTLAIARQLLPKQVPSTTNTYVTMESVFYAVRAEMLYPRQVTCRSSGLTEAL